MCVGGIRSIEGRERGSVWTGESKSKSKFRIFMGVFLYAGVVLFHVG